MLTTWAAGGTGACIQILCTLLTGLTGTTADCDSLQRTPDLACNRAWDPNTHHFHMLDLHATSQTSLPHGLQLAEMGKQPCEDLCWALRQPCLHRAHLGCPGTMHCQ